MITSVWAVCALTLWAEARGEGETGVRAVASVIYQRAGGRPELIAAECRERRQFSCWNGLAGVRLSEAEPQGRPWMKCVSVAMEMYSGEFRPILVASHYHATSIKPPHWTRGMKHVIDIGHHRFWLED